MHSWPFYDPDPAAVINAADYHPPVPGFPALVVSTWSKKIIDRFVKDSGARQVATVVGTAGDTPIYATRYQQADIAFYQTQVGGPISVGMLEEVIAFGGRQFVFFGSCGALDATLVEGHLVVPTAAVRDEGTSRHYLPPGEELELDPAGVAAVTAALAALGAPWVAGKTWTTDAFYRETAGKLAEARRRGCLVVEMECASLAAAARLRGVGFAQFLYTADNLDAPAWQARDLKDHGLAHADRYMAAAMECALRLEGLK